MKETTQHAGGFLRKEMKGQQVLLEIKEKTDQVMNNIGGEKIAIHEVHKYMMG
jgi:hypothetical protein